MIMKRQKLRFWNYHIREKGGIVALGLIFLLGAAAGSAMLKLCSEDTILLLEKLINLPAEESFSQRFWSGFLTEGIQLLFLFVCGFCAIGQPVVLFLILYRGLGLGITGGFLAQQGREAFIYYALILMPQSLLFLTLQLIASKEALAFGVGLFRQLQGGRNTSQTPRVYILRFLILLLMTALAAGFTAIFALLLSRWIT